MNSADFNGDSEINQGNEFDAARKLFPFANNPIKDAMRFWEVDQDGSGSIDYDEGILYSEGKTSSDEQINGLDQAVHEIFKLLDTNPDERLPFDEFFQRNEIICEILNEDCSDVIKRQVLFSKVSKTPMLVGG